jgi:hypothetical protein
LLIDQWDVHQRVMRDLLAGKTPERSVQITTRSEEKPQVR